MSAPLWIQDAGTANKIDLTRLAMALLAEPSGPFIYQDYTSSKFASFGEGEGTKIQIDRLVPLAAPDPDNLAAYLAGAGPHIDVTDVANLQGVDFSKVLMQIRTYRNPKPIFYRKETQKGSQVNLQAAHEYGLWQNFNEFKDYSCREEMRSHACTKIYGGSLRSGIDAMTNDLSTDGYSVAMDKEFKLRASKLRIRAIDSMPGGDKQSLAGYYIAITDQHAINTYEEDPLYKDYVIRDWGNKPQIVKGFVDEFEQVMHIKSDYSAQSLSANASGNPFYASEIIYLATDPVFLEGAQDGVQGYMGQMPVLFGERGVPQVLQNKNDDFEQSQIFDWFHDMAFQATEEMDQDTADAITALLATLAAAPEAALNSSRFIHLGYAA